MSKTYPQTSSFRSAKAGLRPYQDEDVDGAFEVALNPIEKAAVRTLMRTSGVDKNVRNTLRQIAGQGFTPDEMRRLEDLALDKATPEDVKVLWGIEAGTPVIVSANQKTAVDGLIGRLGSDSLAQRARKTYERSLQDGRIRVR